MTREELRTWKRRFTLKSGLDEVLIDRFARCRARKSAVIEFPDGERTVIEEGVTYCHPDAAEVQQEPQLFDPPVICNRAWRERRSGRRSAAQGTAPVSDKPEFFLPPTKSGSSPPLGYLP